MSGLLYPCNVQGMAWVHPAEETPILLPFPKGKDITYTISKGEKYSCGLAFTKPKKCNEICWDF